MHGQGCTYLADEQVIKNPEALTEILFLIQSSLFLSLSLSLSRFFYLALFHRYIGFALAGDDDQSEVHWRLLAE